MAKLALNQTVFGISSIFLLVLGGLFGILSLADLAQAVRIAAIKSSFAADPWLAGLFGVRGIQASLHALVFLLTGRFLFRIRRNLEAGLKDAQTLRWLSVGFVLLFVAGLMEFLVRSSLSNLSSMASGVTSSGGDEWLTQCLPFFNGASTLVVALLLYLASLLSQNSARLEREIELVI